MRSGDSGTTTDRAFNIADLTVQKNAEGFFMALFAEYPAPNSEIRYAAETGCAIGSSDRRTRRARRLSFSRYMS